MKKTWIVVCACCLFVSAAGFAQTPSHPPLNREALIAILGPAAVPSTCATQPSRALFAAKAPQALAGKSLCMATANCESGTVSCQGNNSTTSCSATDRACPGEQGHVTCDGVTTWCPTVCSCNTGTPRRDNAAGASSRGTAWIAAAATAAPSASAPCNAVEPRHRHAPLRQAARRAGLRFFPPATALYCGPPCDS